MFLDSSQWAAIGTRLHGLSLELPRRADAIIGRWEPGPPEENRGRRLGRFKSGQKRLHCAAEMGRLRRCHQDCADEHVEADHRQEQHFMNEPQSDATAPLVARVA